ncbi:hypothetical protein [Metallosphaera yellowstonensis]|uniref:hypothetical protein n=1 Tax=Metallosphaera yellowstonensis TaxID=1111107 RepID=UPI0012DC6008|nr:hypothetical protein [Metallosphaera yellowstonensis]
MRNADETFGLERELMGRWENLEMRGGPFRLVKGPVIVDDTVTARLREDVSPRTTGQQLLDFALITGRYLRESPMTAVVDLLPHPREVREGRAAHTSDPPRGSLGRP